MISISSDFPSHKRVIASVHDISGLRALDYLKIIDSHLSPLQNSGSGPDTHLYNDANTAIRYLENLYGIPAGESFGSSARFSNKEFLEILATCWKTPEMTVSPQEAPRLMNERIRLERISVKALAKYNVIYTTLFQGQTHFSIIGFDPVKMGKSLGEVIQEEKEKRI